MPAVPCAARTLSYCLVPSTGGCSDTRLRVPSRSPSLAQRRVHARCRQVVRAEGNLWDNLNPFKKLKKLKDDMDEKALVKKEKEEANKVLSKEQGEQLFGNGLMGNLMTGFVNSAVGGIVGKFQEAQAGAQAAYEEAVPAVESDARIRDHLGGSVQCTPPLQQFSSSTSVNGVMQATTTVGFIAQGANGRSAQIQVMATESAGPSDMDLEIVAMLDDGSQLEVSARNARYGEAVGGTIDVDAVDVEIMDIDEK